MACLHQPSSAHTHCLIFLLKSLRPAYVPGRGMRIIRTSNQLATTLLPICKTFFASFRTDFNSLDLVPSSFIQTGCFYSLFRRFLPALPAKRRALCRSIRRWSTIIFGKKIMVQAPGFITESRLIFSRHQSTLSCSPCSGT